MDRNVTYFLCGLFLTLSTARCGDKEMGGKSITAFFSPAKVDLKELSVQIEKQLPDFEMDRLFATDTLDTTKYVVNHYLGREYRSFWMDKSGLNEYGKVLIDQIKDSEYDGLDPKDYYVDTIQSLLKDIEGNSSQKNAELELYLTQAYLKLTKHLVLGKLDYNSLNKNWQSKNDTAWSVRNSLDSIISTDFQNYFQMLRPQHPWYAKFKNLYKKISEIKSSQIDVSGIPEEIVLGDSVEQAPSLRVLLFHHVGKPDNLKSSVWDDDLVEALKSYQYANGLEVDGKPDKETVESLSTSVEGRMKKLAMNMERMRWMENTYRPEFIWVNIPEMELDYFEDSSVTFHMNVVVGRTSRKTPVLDSKLSNIVFNPPWYVPPTILKQEVIPGIARRGGRYLSRRGLVARDSRGRRVDPSRINASNFRRFSISQNPGRNSALGSVKFNFPNKEAIYLHDTNHRGDFTKKYRAYSSGCIRVHHPKDFAEFILRDSLYRTDHIDSIIHKGQTTSVNIKRDIGVHIVYLTNAVDSSGQVITVQDLYKWDDELKAYF